MSNRQTVKCNNCGDKVSPDDAISFVGVFVCSTDCRAEFRAELIKEGQKRD